MEPQPNPREVRRTKPPNRGRRRRGQEMIELTLVVMPFMAFTFMLLDIGWAVYTKATLQHAVREGVRYGVTSRTFENTKHAASIKRVVQQSANGLLNGSQGLSKITVQWLQCNDDTGVCTACVSEGCNSGGNPLEVSVDGFTVSPMFPIWYAASPLGLGNIRSADLMEASPVAGPPEM